MTDEAAVNARRKKIVGEFFRLVGDGKPRDGLWFCSPRCQHHDPYVHGDMNALTDAMTAAFKDGSSKYPEAAFAVRHVVTDGDMVAVHTELLNSRSRPGEGGLRQVHLFRFSRDKIVEYWDITQQIRPEMPNAASAF